MKYDITIIGAGIVGLSTAYNLSKANPNLKIIVLEKEEDIALHQTGNNSGVIHSGIYYKPGSLKATNCKKGYELLINFCNENEIEYDLCGKIIVATNEKELPVLDNIYKRGLENGLEGIRKIDSEEIKEIEPYCQGVKGIFVPQTGIIDYKQVARKYLELFQQNGGEILTSFRVNKIAERNNSLNISSDDKSIETRLVINCAGLYSDKLTPQSKDIKIIPFRGEYYYLKPEKEHLVKNLIYPVPNPDFPFLGVHFTRMINGGIEAGPNAVLAFAREGYTNKQVNASELWEILTFKGFHKVAKKYWKEGWMEMKRSYSKKLFVEALQTLVPSIRQEDVVKAKAGIRAQACDRNGNLIDDFLIIEEKNSLHVCNSPSPAATASLSIGEYIAQRAIAKF